MPDCASDSISVPPIWKSENQLAVSYRSHIMSHIQNKPKTHMGEYRILQVVDGSRTSCPFSTSLSSSFPTSGLVQSQKSLHLRQDHFVGESIATRLGTITSKLLSPSTPDALVLSPGSQGFLPAGVVGARWTWRLKIQLVLSCAS